MSPLEESTTDELIEELSRRLPCLLVAGEKPDKTGDAIEGVCRLFGGLTVGLGLHRRLGALLEDALADEFDSDEGD